MKQKPIIGKIRTRQHMIADLAVNHLERHVLLAGFTLQRFQQDYGYDLVMSTYNERGEVEPGLVFFQVKATDDLPKLKDARTVSWTVQRRDFKLWLKDAYPAVLVVYDGSKDKAYWLYLQQHLARIAPAQLFETGVTLNVRIPIANRVNRRAVQMLAKYKNEVHQRLRTTGNPNG
jgi:hypothetical protein